MPDPQMITDAIPLMVTIACALGGLAYIWSANAYRWRYLAQSYHKPWGRPGALKRFQNAIFCGMGVSQAYSGTLTIGVFSDGIGLRLIPPFSLFHHDLFIPYKDIKSWNQQWYVNTETAELEFENAPDVKLQMPMEQLAWIHQQSGGELAMPSEHSPNGFAPTLWITLTWGFIAMTALMVIFYLAGVRY
jgi:hypothetical protein